MEEIAIYSKNAVDNELYHHGILGQKWGVRRYQNKDGTLTPLGKKMYEKEQSMLPKNKRKPVERGKEYEIANKYAERDSQVSKLTGLAAGSIHVVTAVRGGLIDNLKQYWSSGSDTVSIASNIGLIAGASVPVFVKVCLASGVYNIGKDIASAYMNRKIQKGDGKK